MENIKLGTIGTGPIVHWILGAVERTEGISLAAVYSRTYEKGQALADEFHAQKVYTNLDELMSDRNVNTIYIASPNSLHYEQTKKALENGKHVICEKPFCPTKAQAQELIDLAKEKELFLIDAVTIQFLPNFDIIKENISKIGRIRLVLCNYTDYSKRYDKTLNGEKPNIFNPEYAGGCLQDINFYNIYFNVLLFGKPKDVKYYANIFPGLADTSGIAILQYDDFISECTASKDAHGISSVQIEGEKGYIYVNDASNALYNVHLKTNEIDETYNLQDDPVRWLYEIQTVTKLMLSDNYDDIYRRLNTTINVMEIMENARHSADIYFPFEN